MPKEAKVVAMKELDRLSGYLLNHLNIMFQEHILNGYQILPWSKSSKDRIDLKKALDILMKITYGLEKVKQRIIEYLAVQKLKTKKRPKWDCQRPHFMFWRTSRCRENIFGQIHSSCNGERICKIIARRSS